MDIKKSQEGRPQKLAGGKAVTVYLDGPTLDRLDALAKELRSSRSELLRRGIEGLSSGVDPTNREITVLREKNLELRERLRQSGDKAFSEQALMEKMLSGYPDRYRPMVKLLRDGVIPSQGVPDILATARKHFGTWEGVLEFLNRGLDHPALPQEDP